MTTIKTEGILKELRKRVDDYIEATGESKVDIARRAGVRPEMLSRLGSKDYKSSPALETCERIANAVGCHVILIDSE